LFKKKKTSWVLVAHACNPSYSAGRDVEEASLAVGSQPWQIVCDILSQKKTLHKKKKKKKGWLKV
jgi:hypothetical protein